jgi:hypothetical protein
LMPKTSNYWGRKTIRMSDRNSNPRVKDIRAITRRIRRPLQVVITWIKSKASILITTTKLIIGYIIIIQKWPNQAI